VATGARQSSSSVGFAILVLAAALYAIATMVQGIDLRTFLIGAALIYGFVFLMSLARGLDLLEPIWPALGMWLYSYVIRAYGLAKGGLASYAGVSISYVDRTAFERTLGLVLLSLFLFVLGYWWVRPFAKPIQIRRAVPGDPQLNNGYLTITLTFIVIGGMSFLFILRYLGGLTTLLSSLVDRLETFQGLGYPVILVIASGAVSATWVVIAYMRGWRKYRLARTSFLIVSLVYLLLLGGRARVVTILLVVFWAWFNFKKPAFRTTKWLALAVFFIVSVGVFAQLRGDPTGGIGAALDRELAGYGDSGPAGTFLIAPARRTPELDALTVIVEGVPRKLDYQWGVTFLAPLTAFIPTRVYEHKLKGASEVFNSTFFSSLYRGGTGTGIRTGGFLGELYMNFGYVGALGGAFVLGILLRLLYLRLSRYLKPNPDAKQTRHILMYIIAWVHIPQLIRGEFLGTSISIIVVGTFSLLSISIAQRKTPSTTIEDNENRLHHSSGSLGNSRDVRVSGNVGPEAIRG